MAAIRFTARVLILRLICAVTRERNLSLVLGPGVDGDFHARMNLLVISDPIQELNRISARFVRKGSRDPIIYQSI